MHKPLRPVSALRKIRIGSDWTFFHLALSTPLDHKKFKILQLFIIRVVDHRFKLVYRKPMRGFNFVPIPCLLYPEWKPAFTGPMGTTVRTESYISSTHEVGLIFP
jgi:hypothetical protein